MQLLNNQFEVGQRYADIICYMLTSLVYLQQGNAEKKKIKIVNAR